MKVFDVKFKQYGNVYSVVAEHVGIAAQKAIDDFDEMKPLASDIVSVVVVRELVIV